MSEKLLVVDKLSVAFGSGEGKPREVVHQVSFDLDRGKTLALVGESGSGKSVTALSILRLLPYPSASHPSGSIRFKGTELLSGTLDDLRDVRGNDIAFIFQEPMTSLNPLHSIRKQIGEILMLHKGLSASACEARILELLDLVGIADAQKRLNAYPHELSGGQRQRVMIAMALANEPELLIADEPTTALDVTIQAQILQLLQHLQQKLGMAMLLITHDLAVVRKMADSVAVMTDGNIVEADPTAQIFDNPQHAYTRHLMAAEPTGKPLTAANDAATVVEAEALKVYFPIKGGLLKRTIDHVRAVDGLTFTIRKGQTVGVVGESGSGKTTLGLALLRLLPSQGRIVFQGEALDKMNANAVRPYRRRMQIVFQDPFSSLSPRLSIGQIVEEGLMIHDIGNSAAERRTMVGDVLREVGIEEAAIDRYPHEFSGGQRQRIAIARAMVLKPDFVVLDEPTSALDMSVQAQIVDLLRDLQARHNLAYLFISHDLKVVRALADQVIVMRRGQVMEAGSADQIFDAPESAYTRALMAAAFDLEAKDAAAVNM